MGEGSDGKKQLGRILLQQKLVTSGELDELLETQKQSPGERLASTVAQSGKVDPPELLRALSEQQGLPAIDLGQVSIPLMHLGLVPIDVAREHLILPLLVKEDRLFLAMADPDNKRIIDEIEFVTGKRIFPYVALHRTLLTVIDEAYAAAESGEEVFTPPPSISSRPAPPRRPSGRVTMVADPDQLPGAGDMLPMDRATVMAEPDQLPSMESMARDSLGAEPAPGAPGVVVASATAGDDDLSRDSMAMDPMGMPDGPSLDAAFDLERPKRKAPSVRPGSQSILVVDDSDDIRRLMVRVLQEKGYEVFESDRGLDALEKVREHSPDLLLLDAMLPEVHGFDICRRIKGSRRYGHIPVIMVSAIYRGWRFAEDLKRSYGVDEFLEKPFRIGDVVAAVERALSGAEAEPPEQDEIGGDAGQALEQGIAAYSAGDVEVAIAHLKRGIGIDPLAFRLHYHLGLLYGKQDSLFEAIEALESAVDLRPRDFATLKNLAVLYQRAGFRLKATEMWQRALGSAPDDDTRANIKKHLMSLL